MMRKMQLLLVIFSTLVANAQDTTEEMGSTLEQVDPTIVHNTSVAYENQRSFGTYLKEKYSDKDFIYKEEKEPLKKKSSPSTPIDPGFLEGFIAFMVTIFPFLLGLLIVIIILKTFVGVDMRFLRFKKPTKKVQVATVYEEDDEIDETNFDALLKKAINDHNYRLAIRYYYVLLLKQLSHKKYIEYHKDKTNSEYQFEIKNEDIRSQFSYLSYVYSYVWYGEFNVDSREFNGIENKYNSLLKAID